MSATENQLMQAAACFQSCIPKGQQKVVQNYLLAQIRGGTTDVDTILAAAQQTFCCVPKGLWPRLKTYLACEMANASGTIPAYPECTDADALAFIAAANITDETQQHAICLLVRDLKAYPAVGTKYWDREILLYPFVGGNAASHSVNLKNPGGANDITWNGAGFTHDALGVKSSAAAGTYGNLKYLIPGALQNSFRVMCYLDLDSTLLNSRYFGTLGAAGGFWAQDGGTFNFTANDVTTSVMAGATLPPGMFMVQRFEAATKKGVYGVNAWTSFAVASTGVSDRYIYIFCYGTGGVAPNGTPTSLTNCRMSGFAVGAPLDTAGGNAEHLEYKNIWDNFQALLGRSHA